MLNIIIIEHHLGENIERTNNNNNNNDKEDDRNENTNDNNNNNDEDDNNDEGNQELGYSDLLYMYKLKWINIWKSENFIFFLFFKHFFVLKFNFIWE